MNRTTQQKTGGPAPRGLLIDMDGVLWRGAEPLPGVPEFIAALRERSIRFTLVTNNATVTPQGVQQRLRQAGVTVSAGEVLTSAIGAAAYLRERTPDAKTVYAVGEPSLVDALAEAGFQVLDRGQGAEAVVVGMDWQLSWEKLAEASYALAAGAFFLGTNPDRSFPTERGLAPGNGATLAALEAATGRSPTIFGKPEPHLFLQALSRMGTPAADTLVVGDQLDTDILGGQRAGLGTILLLTGVTSADQAAASEVEPDWVYPDLPALTAALSAGT